MFLAGLGDGRRYSHTTATPQASDCTKRFVRRLFECVRCLHCAHILRTRVARRFIQGRKKREHDARKQIKMDNLRKRAAAAAGAGGSEAGVEAGRGSGPSADVRRGRCASGKLGTVGLSGAGARSTERTSGPSTGRTTAHPVPSPSQLHQQTRGIQQARAGAPGSRSQISRIGADRRLDF